MFFNQSHTFCARLSKNPLISVHLHISNILHRIKKSYEQKLFLTKILALQFNEQEIHTYLYYPLSQKIMKRTMIFIHYRYNNVGYPQRIFSIAIINLMIIDIKTSLSYCQLIKLKLDYKQKKITQINLITCCYFATVQIELCAYGHIMTHNRFVSF